MANRVREARERIGMRREELAVAIGVSLNTIKSIEQDATSPSVAKALALAAVLRTPVEELFETKAAAS